jgi:hypothetical protein
MRISKLKQASFTLLLTKRECDDVEEENAKDEDEESKSEEEEPIRKKGKVILTKPTMSSTVVFTKGYQNPGRN